MRIDLHLHSYASGTATNWWVKGLGLGFETRESYTPPNEAYAMAKRAGMEFVALTDHETIDSALTLAHRPDFIVGEEVSAIFPEDGGGVDVLVYGVDATAHRELQARRGDVYALVDYLREAGLVHVLAHPMFELGAPLDRAAVEKRIVLFGLWEFVNGSRPAEQNRLAQEVAATVGPVELRQLAARYGLTASPHHAIGGTGGSDDHGGSYGGATHTIVPAVRDVSELLRAMAAGEVRPAGQDGSVAKMADTGFKLAALASGQASTQTDTGAAVMPAIGAAAPEAAAPARSPETEKLLEYFPFLVNMSGEQIRGVLAGRYEKWITDALRHAGSEFPVLGILSSIGSFIDGHLFIAPYLGVHGYVGRERQKTRLLRRTLFPGKAERLAVGVFVDEMDEIHGVATVYRNLHQLADKPRDDRLQLIQCGLGDGGGAIRLRPLATVPMPLYEGHTLGIPSLLDVLDHVANAGYDALHVATPGPLGLTALIAGSTLGIPIVGAYHTEFGAYAEVLSGDAMVAEIVEVLIREFYERCAVVAVSSASTAVALEARGYQIGRFAVLKNGVDTRLFDPAYRDEARHLALGGRTLLLHAGRVSREKGLENLAEDYLARRDDVHLVVAGDGPYRRELEARLGPAATFTGFLRGEELAHTFAACDVFVFPSTTDTLGRAVAEAQASGLPAVVFGLGGPRECILPGVSGFVVEAGDDNGFWDRIEELLNDPALRARMGLAPGSSRGP